MLGGKKTACSWKFKTSLLRNQATIIRVYVGSQIDLGLGGGPIESEVHGRRGRK